MEKIIDVRNQCQCSSVTYNSFICITEQGKLIIHRENIHSYSSGTSNLSSGLSTPFLIPNDTLLYYSTSIVENPPYLGHFLWSKCVDNREVLNSIGEEHKVSFACCGCEPTVITLARARLWPSSPQRPQIVFTFELLDWAEALLLECQVALKDFCKALYFKCQHLLPKVKTPL